MPPIVGAYVSPFINRLMDVMDSQASFPVSSSERSAPVTSVMLTWEIVALCSVGTRTQGSSVVAPPKSGGFSGGTLGSPETPLWASSAPSQAPQELSGLEPRMSRSSTMLVSSESGQGCHRGRSWGPSSANSFLPATVPWKPVPVRPEGR